MIIETIAGELVTGDAKDLSDISALSARIAAGGVDGASAALELARLVGLIADPDALAARIATESSASALDATTLLVAACFGAVRGDYASRQDAVDARAQIASRADATYRTAGNLDADLLDWLIRLAGETIQQLSLIAADRAPLVRVETGISLPSSVIAWKLYGQPSRGEELAGRNKSGTAMLMPATIEAVAS